MTSFWSKSNLQSRSLKQLTQAAKNYLYLINLQLMHHSHQMKAFIMNKSNGGAQCKQKNTVIPQSNPDPQFCGVHQEMITPQGEAKGLKDCLEEHVFDVSRMKTKCSPVCPFESQTAAWLGPTHGKMISWISPLC